MTKIHLDNLVRRNRKTQLRSFVRFYSEKVFPQFGDIEGDATQYGERLFNGTMGSSSDEDVDVAAIAEAVQDEAISYYEALVSFRRSLYSQSLAGLYHFFEQQVRSFLYFELSRNYSLDPKSFCERGLTDIQELYSDEGVDLTTFASWNKINELRLIANVVKHGDGRSQTDLEAIRQDLFVRYPGDVIDSLFVERVLNVTAASITEYLPHLLQFWDELPERL